MSVQKKNRPEIWIDHLGALRALSDPIIEEVVEFGLVFKVHVDVAREVTLKRR